MKKYNTILVLVLGLLFSQQGFSQIVAGDAFLKGNFVEVAVSSCGTYGTNTPAPVGYHPNVGSILGFVADPSKNGWTVPGPATFPNYMGDYFVPGFPEEGWGIQFTGGTYGNYELCAMTGASGGGYRFYNRL